MDFDLRAHTHLLVVGGSRAYGTARPDSDVDIKGVCIPPARYFHGCLHRFEQADKPEHAQSFTDLLTPMEQDIVKATKVEGTVFSLTKFMALATEGNPNLWDVLWVRDEEVRLQTPLGKKLRDNRDLFLSARARFSFAGYSAAQLKRIKGHRAFLLHPVDHKPTRGEFGLPENTLLPADHLAAVRAAVQKQIDVWQVNFEGVSDTEKIRVENLIAEHLTEMRVALGYDSTEDAKWMAAARTVGLDDNLILVMQREREYEGAFRRWKQFENWKENRNKDRAAIEAEFGLDLKHAMHLVRLLRMCREILTTGKVNVWREDAADLLAIRGGSMTYDQIVEWSEKADKELDALYKAKQYVIPHEPDRKAIDRLCVELVETALSEGVTA